MYSIQNRSFADVRSIFIFLIMLLFSLSAGARQKNSEEARKMFDKVYTLVFGPQGSHVKYAVNILGIYKTEGEIDYKGKKQRYMEARYASWNDGTTAYMVDKKKKTIGIYRADDDNKDKYLAKFKYNVDDYDFSYEEVNGMYELTARVRNSSFFGIREVTAVVKKSNLHPVSMRIKLAFFRTTVQIKEFSSGGIDDKIFIFPSRNFKDYEYTDHRKE